MSYERLKNCLPIDLLLEKGLPARYAWRPWPLRTPFLAGFSTLCIIICASIEIIMLGCAKTGCPVFGALSTTQVSPESNFVYNLLPTILSVCFCFIWAIIHRDVMRLEAYFQMSQPGGAVAENSLLLS